MSEDVVYSDVKFNKKKAQQNEVRSPDQDDVTYAVVRKGKSKTSEPSSSQGNDVISSTVATELGSGKTGGTSSNGEEEVTYSEVRRDPRPKPPSQGTSNVRKRVIIGILIGVLVLAVIGVVAVTSVHKFLATTPNTTATATSPTTTTMTTTASTTTTTATTTTTTATTTTTTTTKSTTTTQVPCTYQCDSGWELNGTKCYYFSTNKLTWTQSEEECVTLGGHLVKINSREEQSFLYKRLRDLMTENEDKFWIGLTDSESEGVWKWTDGSLLDTNLTFWFKNGAQTEPDNWTYNNKYPEGEDCVRMGDITDGYEYKCWFDKHCNIRQRYICEKNPNCIK